MLDFEFKLRWGRVLYIGALAFVIGTWFSIPGGLICLLGILDIKFEDGLFNFDKEDEGDKEDRSGETFGPEKT